MQIHRPARNMQTSLRGIANKARKTSRHRFRHLYSLLNRENLEWCFGQLRRSAAPGIDEVTVTDYEENLESNIDRLVERLKEKRYRTKLVRRKNIPKVKDEVRPLGIPVLEDKLLQMAVAKILTAIYEADFLEFSKGYRPGRGPRKASKELADTLYSGSNHWVVEADIKGFFDNISHEWMMRMLAQRINDKALLRLIMKWLKAGIMEEDGHVRHPITGTPQGGVVSPVLSNIYLHYVLDLWFEKKVKPNCSGNPLIMRFADDFVCAFHTRVDAERFYNVLPKRLGKFELTVAIDKTKILRFSRNGLKANGTFEFLGFVFRWVTRRTGRSGVARFTSPSKLRKSVANFKDWVQKNRHQRTTPLMKQLRSKMRGYYNYYGVRGNFISLTKFTYQVMRILFKWLNRRSHRHSYTWQGFTNLLVQSQIPTPRIVEGH